MGLKKWLYRKLVPAAEKKKVVEEIAQQSEQKLDKKLEEAVKKLAEDRFKQALQNINPVIGEGEIVNSPETIIKQGNVTQRYTYSDFSNLDDPILAFLKDRAKGDFLAYLVSQGKELKAEKILYNNMERLLAAVNPINPSGYRWLLKADITVNALVAFYK
ncbi:hypothetical protein HZA33_02415 [Candidatus Pacearchaeota archaeon]|nr:hypothetical protein [Candidatus Pacearchaeota archaeon]